MSNAPLCALLWAIVDISPSRQADELDQLRALLEAYLKMIEDLRKMLVMKDMWRVRMGNIDACALSDSTSPSSPRSPRRKKQLHKGVHEQTKSSFSASSRFA